jgi:hypothetical protein
MQRINEEGALLIAQGGPLDGQRWLINKTTVVGRDPECDIVIPDRQVSRRHAQFEIDSQGISIVDLGSKNGTHCNGEAITDPQPLNDGDVILIALAQKFIYLSSDSTLPLPGHLPTPDETDLLQVETGAQPDSGMQPTSSAVDQPPSGRLHLDIKSRRVWIALTYEGMNAPAEEIELKPPLSAAQFDLLALLYNHPGQVIPRLEIAQAIWGDTAAYGVSEQAIDALVRRLRERLASLDPSHPYITTLRGQGLRLDNPLD